ncbi:polysaccharide deacetylase family protein [Helicobacter sp. T3_23-1056]
MKICIAGYGYVGKAFYEFFKTYEHYQVFVYDNSKEIQERYDFVKRDCNILNSADLVVVCVPTPSKDDGSVDISFVENVLANIRKQTLVLIKSTIPPNTTNILSKKYLHLRIVFSPEYIGESTYDLPYPYDFNKEVIKTPYFIFGGDIKDTAEIVDIFSKIAGPVKEYIQTTSLNAEICKYMENSFFATKIIFCNEFYKICETFGADYNSVRELWLKDPRITKTHTAIYNKDDNLCFGGKCLPKDLSGIVKHSTKNGYKPEFLEEVLRSNKRIREEENTNILMIHRILYNEEQKINPLYFDRNMIITYEKLKSIIEFYLGKGFEFGNIKECIENPNKYFCLSFDDGFKEHLWAAKDLVKSYNIKKQSLLFAINVGDSIYHKFSGMDAIYYLVQSKRLEEAFKFFNLKMPSNNLYANIQIFKKHYIKQPSNILLDFYNAFSIDLSLDFLDNKDIQELSEIATICSHGITHRDLTFHKEDSDIEIMESKNILEKIINDKISIFVYPEGKSDNDLYKFCKNHGYEYCLSIKGELNNRFRIGRKDVKNYGYNCNE